MLRRWFYPLLLVLITSVFVGLAVPPAAQAEEWPTDPHGYAVTRDEAQAYYAAIQDCSTPSLECLVRNVSRFTALEWIQDINGPKADCMSNPDTCNESTSDKGALRALASLIGKMYDTPPASSVTYVADVLNSINISTPAYAQGLGFASLDPILPLWKTFRNIAYMFFAVIFVLTGFLIMFRQKVGQTAITAQQAIPKIIVSLLMVTFSYAIAGFMIDMMYLSMTLIMGIFDSVLGGKNYMGMNIIGLGAELWKQVYNVGGYSDLILNAFEGLTGSDGVGAQIVSVFGGITLSIILTIAMLIGVVKLFFELLRAYATIVISIVISPLTLMMNAIPGNNAFMTWIKTLIGHLIPFPTVLAVLAIFGVFMQNSRDSGGFMPPFLLGGGQSGTVTYILGLAILLALPEIVKHIREAIAPKNTFAEMVLGAASGNTKAALPLGGRVVGGLGGAAGGAVGGAALGGLVGGGRAALEGARMVAANPRAITRLPGTIGRGILGGALMGQQQDVFDKDGKKTGTRTVRGVGEGFKIGSKYGVRGGASVGRSVGANQPDILNPVTGLIDRVDPKTKEAEKSGQFWEDLSQRIRKSGRGE